MVYGMDVERERSHDQQIAFLPTAPAETSFAARRAAHRPRPRREQADEGRLDGAGEIADAALKANPPTPRRSTCWGALT